MAAIHPRHILCILGNWPTFDEVEAIVTRPGFQLDREFSRLAPDDRTVGAFYVSYDRVSPSMTDGDWRAIDNHAVVAYVLSPPCRANASLEVSRHALLLVTPQSKHTRSPSANGPGCRAAWGFMTDGSMVSRAATAVLAVRATSRAIRRTAVRHVRAGWRRCAWLP